MAKKEIKDIAGQIKKLLDEKRAVIGTKRTIKELKRGRVAEVFLSLNCPASVREDVEHYSRLSRVNVVQLQYSNNELGIMCKKPFAISVLSVLK